jgi:hypothetical protein
MALVRGDFCKVSHTSRRRSTGRNTLALLIGLPIVLVIAWYHGDRGQQRLSAPELTILTLLFLVGGGIFWWYQRGGDTPTTTTQPDLGATPAAVTDSPPFDCRPAVREPQQTR